VSSIEDNTKQVFPILDIITEIWLSLLQVPLLAELHHHTDRCISCSMSSFRILLLHIESYHSHAEREAASMQ
jgi:hypothetical protein